MTSTIELTKITNWLNCTYEEWKDGNEECAKEFRNMRYVLEDIFDLNVSFVTDNHGGRWVVH